MTDTAASLGVLPRGVDLVHAVVELGPDGQVDRKAIVLPPGNFERFDPFLLLAEDWFSQPGFDWHPHRGIETVTIVLDGALEHGDSRGNAGVLAPGDVQWMTAGSGIIHRELAYRDEHVHTLQLWVNLPAAEKMVESQYRDFTAAAMAAVAPEGVEVLVVPQHRPITVLQVSIEPGRSYDAVLPAGDRAFLYLRSGALAFAGIDGELAAGQVAWSDPVADAADGGSSVLSLSVPGSADAPARFLLASGTPLREPVVARGPFVMNTEAQIIEAFADFRRGRFGPMPRLARVTS